MEPPSLPGYKFLRYLGGGRQFEVWEARPSDEAVPVAVKLPRREAAGSTTALTLLRREARAGVTVRHPRIVRLVRSHAFDPPYFVVLELVPGETLRTKIKRDGPLTVRRAVWACRQAAEGLAALHSAGFLHADVKPDNVRVTPLGEAKVIDLAFAHKPGENRKLNGAGFILGTANYLAPELLRTPPVESGAVDVFGLGATLFECLTARLPYPARTVEEALELRRTEDARDLADVRGDWPDRLVELVRAMLDREPRNRPPMARVVRELVQVEIDVMARGNARRAENAGVGR